MDRRTRKLIEWAFFNYEANKRQGSEEICALAERGIVPSYEQAGRAGSGVPDPTADKAALIYERAKRYLWAKVVENTLTAFRFEQTYDILVGRYFDKRSHTAIMTGSYIPERTYFYQLDKALAYAEMWVDELMLM